MATDRMGGGVFLAPYHKLLQCHFSDLAVGFSRAQTRENVPHARPRKDIKSEQGAQQRADQQNPEAPRATAECGELPNQRAQKQVSKPGSTARNPRPER